MNIEQLRALLWLRWRLRINQLRRGGIENAILLGILGIGVVLLAVGLFVGSFALGRYAFQAASPAVHMYAWDGIVVGVLFLLAIGLLIEVQRAEALSLEKFLHLPVSPFGGFAINYISTLFNLNMILIAPPMFGLCLGLAFAKGPAMLLLLLPVAAFLLMATALVYQFQGWLASLMVNKRRRRTIIVMVTMGFILLCQLPNVVNMVAMRRFNRSQTTDVQQQFEQVQELTRQLAEEKITTEEFQKRQQAIQIGLLANQQASSRQLLFQVERIVGIANFVFPPGWLPLSASALVEGKYGYTLLAALSLSLIGSFSLWRAYRTTLRLYTGQVGSEEKTALKDRKPAKAERPPDRLLERRLPWISEQTAIVALGGFRSLVRAPEAKMMLLSPIFVLFILGATFVQNSDRIAQDYRPLLAFGAIGMILLTTTTLVGNQFGFDRSGFRFFVLCPARRRDVLVGKNLAVAPFILGVGLLILVLFQALAPMRIAHFFALLPALVSMYLLFCLMANSFSILAPMPIASGGFKPANPKAIPILLQFVFIFLLPLVLLPTLLPFGAEFGLQALGWSKQLPVFLILSVVECALVILFYSFVVHWQGYWLQSREQAILEIVASKTE